MSLFGAQFWRHKVALATGISEARVFWQWCNYLVSQVAPPKRLLWVNMDETSVAYTYGGARGNVVSKRRRPADAGEPTERLTRGEQRGAITYAAFVCSEPAAQSVLPQILIGNKHMFTQRLMRAISAEVPCNVHLWAEPSSWMNIWLLVKTLKLLGRALEPFLSEYQPILLLDCAPQHIHWRIANAAALYGIWLVYVPAKLTWLLQPCDTHLFSYLKAWLRREYTRRRSETLTGRLSGEGWLRMLFHAVAAVVNARHWSRAFDEVGAAERQARLTAYVRSHTAHDLSEIIPALRLTPDALQLSFPASTRVPYRQLFKLFLSEEEKAALERPPRLGALTRSASRAALVDAAPSSCIRVSSARLPEPLAGEVAPPPLPPPPWRPPERPPRPPPPPVPGTARLWGPRPLASRLPSSPRGSRDTFP